MPNIVEDSVPKQPSAAAIWRNLIKEVILVHERLLCESQLSILINWLFEVSNHVLLDDSLESSANQCALSPLNEHLVLLLSNAQLFHTVLILNVRCATATHILILK